jgi:hypothetical protein
VQTSGVTRLTVLVFVALTIAVPFPASAYAVFAHEANVDALWGTGIRPLLERRYPRATREQLQDARAYAYGGSVIQDLGYYQVNAFIYRYTRKQYEQEFGAKYRKPGLLARFVGLLYRMLPKFGPLRPLRFKTPSPEAERLFSASFRETRARYAAALTAIGNGTIDLVNTDLDTGKPSVQGEYELADQTYFELLERLADRRFASLPPALHTNIAAYYAKGAPAGMSRSERKRADKIQQWLVAMSR